MLRLLFTFSLLVLSQGLAWSDDIRTVFDPNVYYDIYCTAQEEGSYVIRRIKIVDKGSIDGNSYLVIKTDKSFKDSEGQGIVFMKGISSVIPSSYFRVEKISH